MQLSRLIERGIQTDDCKREWRKRWAADWPQEGRRWLVRILAIDHGTKLVGWSVWDGTQFESYGIHRMESTYPSTLVELSLETDRLIDLADADAVALERPMSLRGGDVAQKLIEHYTVCKLSAITANKRIIEVAPPTIKLIVAGAGNADKQTVADSLCIKWGLDLEELCPAERYKAGSKKGTIKLRLYDSSDACALAIAADEMNRRELRASG